MSSPATTAGAPALLPEPMITIKLSVDGTNRKFKLPLKDLVAPVFSDKIRKILQLPETQKLLLERFSDSGNAFVALEPDNAPAYKQLYRAAKAKQKLKLRATLLSEVPATGVQNIMNTTTASAPTLHRPTSSTSSFGTRGNMFTDSDEMRSQRNAFMNQLANAGMPLMARAQSVHPAAIGGAWQVFCNNCDMPMADAHYHCSICDDGDYDLCQKCVSSGVSCHGEEHWLIKRVIEEGRVVNSKTETIAPRSSRTGEGQRKLEMPGAFKHEQKPEPFNVFSTLSTRTCNGCVRVLPESLFLNCLDCDDFDLCTACFSKDRSHHPAHSFAPAQEDVKLDGEMTELCKANRNERHAAICDGCDMTIYGVRHKCLSCPDFDYCSACHSNSAAEHAGHRFVPIYESLPLAQTNDSRHYGIYCDGPLCNGKPHQTYIKGIRYKCAVCPDFDLCGNCESHPTNKHNETHPLIKFKTPVRNVSVSTYDEQPGHNVTRLGDLAPRAPARYMPRNSSATTLPPYTTASAPVQQPITESSSVVPDELDAHFVKDVIADGTTFPGDSQFTQTWTIRNPGPHAWPAGVSVCHVGGDNMLDLDRTRATTVVDLAGAQRSNATFATTGPGKTFEFSINMRAPSREGKHVSYWRLKGPDGTPFGHKLWCDIAVSNPSAVVKEDPTAKNDVEESVQDSKAQIEALEARIKAMKLDLHCKTTALDNANRVIFAHAGVTLEKQQRQSQSQQPSCVDESEHERELKESQVIMPTLERDGTPSTSNSIHRDSVSEGDLKTASESVAATETKTETETVATDEVAKTEDLEDVEFESADEGSELGSEDDEDDGFMTDEEYDILDASDEEARGL